MEQHPIPQNVTSFQFKLVGDITLKQFAYLAGCSLAAYLMTRVGFIPALFRYPIAGFLALLGIGLAFVPIEERPMDRWIVAFFRSIYSPTQYIYKKNNLPPEVLNNMTSAQVVLPKPVTVQTPLAQAMAKKAYVSSLPKQTKPKESKTITPPAAPPKPYKPPVVPIPKPATAAPKPQVKSDADKWKIGAPPVPGPKVIGNYASSQSLTGKKVDFSPPPAPTSAKTQNGPVTSTVGASVTIIKNQYQQMEKKLSEQNQSLQKELQEGTIAKERLIEVQQVLSLLLAEKERLSLELIRLQKQLLQKEVGTIEKPTNYTTLNADTRSTIKMVAPQTATQVGMPKLTNQANVITGIIKTSSGNLLPNIIVTVQDKEGVPVRALKTNRLGQFAASTPLTAGVYLIEIEDPKKTYQFHRIEVNLINEVIPALEISAINERDIVRQKLTQELFGKNKI